MNYSNCILIPRKGILNPKRNKFIENSLLKRLRFGVEQIVSDTSYDIKIEPVNIIESGYYAGIKVNHFGHFLLESLSRLAKLKMSDHINVIWISKGNSNSFTQWQKDIFQLLKIDKFNHIIINEPTLISNIEINQQEYMIWDVFTQNHKKFLGLFQTKDGISGRKLWISREYVEGGWVNEKLIQNVLIENGWEIFHPEKYSIYEQLEMMLTSKVIAGTEGSAFHLLLLAKEVKQTVIIFSRITNNGLKTHKINNNYKLIAKVKGIHQIEITPNQSLVEGKKEKANSIVNYYDIFKTLELKYNNSLKENYE